MVFDEIINGVLEAQCFFRQRFDRPHLAVYIRNDTYRKMEGEFRESGFTQYGSSRAADVRDPSVNGWPLYITSDPKHPEWSVVMVDDNDKS